ncbi:type III secretion system chaperone family protein [Cellulomonas timonensis]|uniref:hypothetical protein n=1 Tax=Cellulomonas timonensis TaxID=1689271 RepID=UPI00082CFD46|nr:hypothetical protein [Cellulomonas timonensis]
MRRRPGIVAAVLGVLVAGSIAWSALAADGTLLAPVVIGWLVVGGVALAWWLDEKRHERLAQWAAARGWAYQRQDQSLVSTWSGEPFGEGHSRRATEVLRGAVDGHGVVSFTYRWTVGSGKEKTTHTRHVVALGLPTALPTLELTPEWLGTRVLRAFGGQDIQFESEDFNRAWRVRARNLKFAHDVVHPRLMARLLLPDAQGTSLRVEGATVLTWMSGRTDPARIDAALTLLRAVSGAVPQHVWEDMGRPTPR